MPPPKVLRDTYIVKSYLDSLTKIIVLVEFIVGINRLPLLGVRRRFFTALGLSYSLFVNGFVIYAYLYGKMYTDIYKSTLTFEYFSCTIIGALTCRRIRSYYVELNRFDDVYGCHPKTKYFSLNFISFIVLNATIFTLIVISIGTEVDIVVDISKVPVYLIHAGELSYYGHLFYLLLQRIRVINLDVKLSLHEKQMYDGDTELKKQMKLYHIVIDAYDLLGDSIKWQFVIMITMSFLFILGLSCDVVLKVLSGNEISFDSLLPAGMAIVELTSLFLPCVLSEQVHNEVKRLKELLASRLYDNKLDKSTRSNTRTLLQLTKSQNLSFVLIRTLDVNIAFPFKFMQLLVTYLIIVLQFQKVFNTVSQ